MDNATKKTIVEVGRPSFVDDVAVIAGLCSVGLAVIFGLMVWQPDVVTSVAGVLGWSPAAVYKTVAGAFLVSLAIFALANKTYCFLWVMAFTFHPDCRPVVKDLARQWRKGLAIDIFGTVKKAGGQVEEFPRLKRIQPDSDTAILITVQVPRGFLIEKRGKSPDLLSQFSELTGVVKTEYVEHVKKVVTYRLQVADPFAQPEVLP